MTATRRKALVRFVSDRRFARWLGFALVGGALFATGVRLADQAEPPETVTVHSPLFPSDPLSAELARCRAITDPAAVDNACRAAWAENRRLFLGIPKAQDRLTPDHTQRPSAAPKDK